MTKTRHKRTVVASVFQNGISRNIKCAIRDGFHRNSHIWCLSMKLSHDTMIGYSYRIIKANCHVQDLRNSKNNKSDTSCLACGELISKAIERRNIFTIYNHNMWQLYGRSHKVKPKYRTCHSPQIQLHRILQFDWLCDYSHNFHEYYVQNRPKPCTTHALGSGYTRLA